MVNKRRSSRKTGKRVLKKRPRKRVIRKRKVARKNNVIQKPRARVRRKVVSKVFRKKQEEIKNIRQVKKKSERDSQGMVTSEVTHFKHGCADHVLLSLTLKKDVITSLSVELSKTSCPEVRESSKKLQQHIVGKHISEAYRITSDMLEDEHFPHHGATLVIHALREALLQYESSKAHLSLQEALEMLQAYDEGLPPRDLSKDYEY
jgi:NifU-like protein involved in Fe-S cluster formation